MNLGKNPIGRFSSALMSGVVAFVRLMVMFGINKLLAYHSGPTGILLLGQFQNLQRILSSLGTLGMSQGAIKLVAEENSKNNIPVVDSLRFATIFSSIIVGVLVFTISQPIALFFFDRNDYQIVVQILGLLLIFNSFNTMTISFLNGKKEIRKWGYVNLVQVAMTLLMVSWGSFIFGTKGALVGFSTAHVVAFGVNYQIIKKSGLVLFVHNLRNVDLNILRRSVGFSTFTFVSLIFVPLSIFFVRDAVLVQYGEAYAGYWQGVFFLCTAFQTLITTAFSVYYLPTISAENDKSITQREVLTTLYLAFFVSLFGHLVLYLFRDPAIKIVFNSDFLPMADLFLWQLVGSHFKICAWVYSYLLFSRDQTSWLISLEVVFSISFIALTHFFLTNYGMNGANLAFAVNNFLYLVVVILLTRNLRILSEDH